MSYAWLQGSPGANRRDLSYGLHLTSPIEDGQVKRVSYIPCYVNKRAEPEIVTRSDPRGQEVFRYMEDISRTEGLPVHFSWEGDEALISA